jgi:hypothetical protein
MSTRTRIKGRRWFDMKRPPLPPPGSEYFDYVTPWTPPPDFDFDNPVVRIDIPVLRPMEFIHYYGGSP